MDARDPQQRMSYRLGKLLFVLTLTASWAAHAVLDQVAPETVPVYTSRMCIPNHPISSCQANTLRAACDLYYQVSMAGGYIVPNPAPVFTGIVGGYAQLQYTYSCMYNFYYMHNVSSVPYQAYYQDRELAIVDVTPPLCPAATPAYKFNAVSGMCERDVPDKCLPPNIVNPETGKCEPPPPPPCTAVGLLPPLPTDDKDYACTQSLDKGAGKDVDGVCPPLNAKLTVWNGEMNCLANKIHALGIPYKEPSSTIRTEAYQQHLLAVWTKWNEIENKDWSDAEKQSCAAVIADVQNQKELHGIDSDPSRNGSNAPHVKGIAFDIPRDVAKALIARVTMTKVKASIAAHHPGCISCLHIPLVTGDVQDYINNPPACKLKWGGKFSPVDKVHFQLPSQLP